MICEFRTILKNSHLKPKHLPEFRSRSRKGEPVFQLCKVDMTADDAEEEGMVCGGVVEVMLEMI